MLYFCLTLAVACLVGAVFLKIKVPGGLMVGSIVGVAVLSIGFDAAYMPSAAKVASQVVAGAFIGCTVEKEDLRKLKHIGKPLLLMVGGMFTVNMVMGFLTYLLTPLDLITSLMSCVPGGMTDIPIISADLGADSAKVAAMQFVRMLAGLGIIPSLVHWVGLRNPQLTVAAVGAGAQAPDLPLQQQSTRSLAPKAAPTAANIALTLAVATVCGIVGKISGMPAGTLTFSLVGVLTFKFLCNRAVVPQNIKRLAQILAGAYIGSSMTRADLLEMRFLVIPSLLLAAGYVLNCLISGYLMHRLFGMDIREGMLACTPAGASDMALISSDLGVQSTDLVVLQILRLLIVIVIFPPVIVTIVSFFG